MATLTISANDAAAGSLQFTPNPADQTVAENVGTATFTVSRTGGTGGAVSTTVTLGGTATLGVGFDYTTSALTLNWADGDGADKTITVTVNDDALPEGAETVTLTLGAPTGGATLGVPSLATLTISANDAAMADLGVTKTDSPDPVLAGANITYTIALTNNGPNDAATVALTDVVPTNTTFVSLTSPAGYACTTPAVGAAGTVTCNRPTILNGVTDNFMLVVQVGAATANGTIITNTATVASATTDANPANDGATAQTTVAVAGTSADLIVTKSDSPDPVLTGAQLTYTITVRNFGPDPSTAATVTDALPAGTTFQSCTTSVGSCTGPAVGVNGTVTANLGTLASGATATVTIVANVTAAGGSTLNNTAPAASATIDPNPANNSATATTQVSSASAELLLTKSDSPDPIGVLSTLTYSMTVRNNGPGPATNVTLTDNLPASVTFISASPGCTNVALVVTCSMGTIASGGTSTVTIQVMTTTIGLITNNATVTAAEPDPIPGNNSTSATTNVLDMIPTLSPMMLFLLALALGSVVFTIRGMR